MGLLAGIGLNRVRIIVLVVALAMAIALLLLSLYDRIRSPEGQLITSFSDLDRSVSYDLLVPENVPSDMNLIEARKIAFASEPSYIDIAWGLSVNSVEGPELQKFVGLQQQADYGFAFEDCQSKIDLGDHTGCRAGGRLGVSGITASIDGVLFTVYWRGISTDDAVSVTASIKPWRDLR